MDHLLERYELKTEEPEVPAEVTRKDASPTKKTGKDDEKQDVESEGKYELHISNISLKATESDLRKLFE